MCRVKHRWKDCPYIFEWLRLAGFKVDSDIQKKIKEQLESGKYFKTFVARTKDTKAKENVAKDKRDLEDKTPSVLTGVVVINQAPGVSPAL